MNQTTIEVLNRINEMTNRALTALVNEIFHKNSSGLYPDNSQLKELARELKDTVNIELHHGLELVERQIMQAAAYRFTQRTQELIPITIADEANPDDAPATGFVQLDTYSVGIGINGYNDTEKSNCNSLVVVEKSNCALQVLLYEDGNDENPTQVINVEGAKSPENKG